MNIVFILSNYPGYGGIEKVSNYLASYMVSCGHHVTFLSYGTNAPSLIERIPSSIKLVFLPESSNYASKKNTYFIRDFFTNNKIDYIIFQDSYAPIEHIVDEIEYPWNKKLLIVEHNTPMYAIKTINSYFYYNEGWIFFFSRIMRYIPSIIKAYVTSRKRRLFLLRHCRKYILLSESFRKEMHFIVGRNYDSKLIPISNPLTVPETFENDFSTIKKKQILFVGRISNQKGFNFLVKIWEEFVKYNDDSWELVLLAAGIGKDEIENQIKRHNLSNIRIDKPTTEIHRYYEESQILVMTSIYEGFPLVLTEAMSRGCVPIAFDSFRSIHDLIENGVNGILVPPFDIKLYAKKMSDLTHNMELLKKMSKNTIDTSSHFSLDSIGEKWINLFNQLKTEE